MTTDITELAPAMKAAAEKASGGDWVKESGDGWDATCSNDDQANCGFIIAHFVGPDSEANREFVQLANPANILLLVEALEKAQAKNALVAGGIEAATKLHERIAELDAELEREREKSRRVMSRIAELESRTVTVKLPRPGFITISGERTAVYLKADVDAVLTAVGIKWEAE